jgi:hypothetical protein
MYLVHQGHKPLLNLMKGCIIIHAQDIHVGIIHVKKNVEERL